MPSAKRKKNQSGSAQVGEWKFTYQDRIRSFSDVDLGEGDAALSAYAELFGRVERSLFAQFSVGVSLTSLKNEYLVKYRLKRTRARFSSSGRVVSHPADYRSNALKAAPVRPSDSDNSGTRPKPCRNQESRYNPSQP